MHLGKITGSTGDVPSISALHTILSVTNVLCYIIVLGTLWKKTKYWEQPPEKFILAMDHCKIQTGNITSISTIPLKVTTDRG